MSSPTNDPAGQSAAATSADRFDSGVRAWLSRYAWIWRVFAGFAVVAVPIATYMIHRAADEGAQHVEMVVLRKDVDELKIDAKDTAGRVARVETKIDVLGGKLDILLSTRPSQPAAPMTVSP